MIKHTRGGRAARRRSGFSLTEMLVTLLIVMMLGLAVSAGVTAGARAYRQSVFAAESETLSSTLNTALSDVLRYASAVQPRAAPAAPTFNNANYSINGGTVLLDEDGYLVFTQEPPESAGSYTMLVNRGVYSKLKLSGFTMAYNAATGVFSGGYAIEWLDDASLKTEVEFTFRSISE